MRGEIFNEINANPISKINIFILSKCEIGNIFATSKCNNFWNALHLTSKGVETEKLRKKGRVGKEMMIKLTIAFT